MRYATTKRVEHNTQQRKTEDMDTNRVADDPGYAHNQNDQNHGVDPEGWRQLAKSIPNLQQSLIAITKGKGKGPPRAWQENS